VVVFQVTVSLDRKPSISATSDRADTRRGHTVGWSGGGPVAARLPMCVQAVAWADGLDGRGRCERAPRFGISPHESERGC
jgi:hypothetical protein